jgi:drug/metabolite transporter (DMT)-like permease
VQPRGESPLSAVETERGVSSADAARTTPSLRNDGTLKAVLAAATGSTLVGGVPMLAVGLYRDGMDAQSLLFWRYWIALSVLWPLAVWTSPSLGEDWRRAGRFLFLNGITLGVLQTYTYFRAVETIPSSIVVTIFFTYPIMTLAIEAVILRRRPGIGSVAAVGLVFAGALMAGWPNLSFEASEPIGLLCATATPIGFAVYILVAWRCTRDVSPFAAAAAIYSGLGCGYAVVVAMTGLALPTGWHGVGALLLIGIVGGVVQISAFAYALPRLSASGYSIIVSLELITVVVLGVLVLGETLTPVQGAGVVLVAIGIVTDRLLRPKR